MTEKLTPKPTQCQKVLRVLQDAHGEYVSGRYFLHQMYLSQYHARIFELQRQGYEIEASEEKDEYGYKAYRLVQKVAQLQMF